MNAHIRPWQLRAALAARLSGMFAAEVPLYSKLVGVCRSVNASVVAASGSDVSGRGGVDRVTAERHAAVRVGTPAELRDMAQIFAALGMKPVGFYDLRAAAPTPLPVVATAFRPIDSDDLERNAFRVFTSMLVVDDARFFDAGLQQQLRRFLSARSIFPIELIDLARRIERDAAARTRDAERFLTLCVDSFRLSRAPIDQAWYRRLEAVSSVAADIGGVSATHINHLTPRVLDIDELYRRMTDAGAAMISDIQGPPRWTGPDVLLRQTSFRALAEPRTFRTGQTLVPATVAVRFGEVESRGVALTPTGRDGYDAALREVDARLNSGRDMTRQQIAEQVWHETFPPSIAGLADAALGWFTYTVRRDRPADGTTPPADLRGLVSRGWIEARPILYEDFLPRSAAGIFHSNLAGTDCALSPSETTRTTPLDAHRLAELIDRPVLDPMAIYAQQQATSLDAVRAQLGLARAEDYPPSPAIAPRTHRSLT